MLINTSLEAAIRENLARYLAGELTIQGFEDWFVPATWNQIGRVPLSTERLIGEIELRLAEFTSEHRAALDLHGFFVRALGQYMIGVPPYTTLATGTLTKVVTVFRVESPERAGPSLLSATGSW